MQRYLMIGLAAVTLVSSPAGAALGARYYAPMEEYLNQPFDNGDACAVDSGLTAGDYHLIGGPKHLERTYTVYNDDGSLKQTEKAVVDFAPNGNILRMQNFSDGSLFSETRYEYNARGQIATTQWRFAGSGGPPCAFAYDPNGRLTAIAFVRGSDSSVISISYMPDGRLKEAIKRKSVTNKGVWRLAYSYAGSTVTIERFADEDGKQTKQKAVFELFPDKGVHKASYDVSYGHGTFVYARLPKGLMLARDDRVNAEDGNACTTSFWIHRNGEIDRTTNRVSGKETLYCFNPRSPVAQVYFDKRGNLVVERSGSRVDELGRKVTRWSEVTLQQITYYPK